MKHRHLFPSSQTLRKLLVAALPCFAAGALVARPTTQDSAQAGARPASGLQTAVSFFYALSPRSGLEGGAAGEEVSINHYEIEFDAAKRVSDDMAVFFGLSDRYTDLDISGAVPLPETLHAVGLSVGARRSLADCIGPDWSGTVRLGTEFSADSSALSDAGATFTGAVFVSRRQSDTFSWDLGLLARSHGDLPVLPLIGAKWAFAPQWAATLGFPETAVTYRQSERLSLQAGVGLHGGLYHVSTARAPGLGDTWLEYSEIRVGITVTYELRENLTLTLGGGAVVDREFDYYDRDRSVDGESASYLSLGLKTRF
ncbi:hypothetical protein ASA1KI_43770 [Opitutales bacterium ASA1]|uniref:DUF6268 family outer membrane beta-barrel protein n=1 Tax=Congregicoccus parvus TaxID=3081749 RepID=UPI002B28F001|nr:hypothetical protein ASA1KI_43770 [Opitutales bacterium ASA1]